MKAILLIGTALALGFVSCEHRNVERVEAKHNHIDFQWVEIDTVCIHGNPHEMLINHVKGGAVFEHSPECWCLKNDTINETQN